MTANPSAFQPVSGRPRSFESLVITLPIPPKELSPNARVHYMAKARKVKEYRTKAKVAALAVLNGVKPKHQGAITQLDWHAKTARRIDSDNALSMCKALFDGVTDSGYLDDDRGLTHLPIRFHVSKTNPRVVLTITPQQ